MTARRRLVVHIGMPKAGSTTIQHMLRASALRLRELGVEMPIDTRGAVEPRLRGLPGVVPGMGSDRRHHLERTETWDTLGAQLRRSTARQFVISDEGLLSTALATPPKQVARLADGSGRDLRLVAYVRPQYQYLESRYSQWVKDGVQWLPFDAFVGAALALRPIDQHPWLNYRQVFGRWRDVFGDRLTVVPLERSSLTHGLWAHFLQLLGACDMAADTMVPVKNARWGAKSLEVSRLALSAWWWRGWRFRKDHQILNRRIPGLLGCDEPFAGFTADEAQRLMACFHAENAVFAREYGIDSDGILFRDPVVDDRSRPNVASWSDLEDRERSAVRVLLMKELGVDAESLTRQRSPGRAALDSRTRLGSAQWHARWLLEPRLPYWYGLLRWRMKRARFVNARRGVVSSRPSAK